jgi:Flp pilus assembly protein TadD
MTSTARCAGGISTVLMALFAGSSCATLKPKDQKAEALEHWNQVRARVKNQLASQQYTGGYFEECARTAAESIRLDPAGDEAYGLLARSQLELSRPASAQQAIDAARQRGIRSAELAYVEGVILEDRNQLDAAYPCYREALALQPAHADALVAAAELLAGNDRPEEALALLREHGDRMDDRGTVALLSARIARLVGDESTVAASYLEALAHRRQAPAVALEAGMYLVQTQRWSSAASVLEPLSRSEDAELQGSAVQGLALCRLAMNDSPSAQSLLLSWLARKPDDGRARMLLARAALAAGDEALARSSIRIARELLPRDFEVRFLQALLDWREGAYESARTVASELLRERPGDADVLCLMGELLAVAGETDGARESFERALMIAPTSSWASSSLERLVDPAGSR